MWWNGEERDTDEVIVPPLFIIQGIWWKMLERITDEEVIVSSLFHVFIIDILTHFNSGLDEMTLLSDSGAVRRRNWI